MATINGGTIKEIQTVNGILDVQQAVCDAILENTYFARSKIQVIPENALDIVTMIRKELGKLGIVGMVMTPRMEFAGKNPDGHPVWRMDEVQVAFTEIPTVNRGRAGASTALDAALQAAESLNETGLQLQDIQQAEEAGYIVVTVICQAHAFFCYERVDVNTPAESNEPVNTPVTP